MIHVPALPGTPKSALSPQAIIAQAVEEAQIYCRAGVDALIIENMHDRPYLNRSVGPEIVSTMTAVALAVKKESVLPCGIQILAGANHQALAVAHAAGLDFIRAEGFVFAHVADEGMMDSDAGSLLRYRKQIGAERIRIITDIKKKHSAHAITSDISLVESAEAAAFFLSDGIIITGSSTAKPASPAEVKAVKAAIDLPVWVGSGIKLDNLENYLPYADAFVVGSSLKKGGDWMNPIETERVKEMAEKIHGYSQE